jgi:hypothetical protein
MLVCTYYITRCLVRHILLDIHRFSFGITKTSTAFHNIQVIASVI